VSTEECTDGRIAGHIIIDSVLGLALANMRTPPEQEKGGVSGPSQAGSAPATYLDALGDSTNDRKLAEHKIATCPVPFQQPPRLAL
jgi:hypothetical protein